MDMFLDNDIISARRNKNIQHSDASNCVQDASMAGTANYVMYGFAQ
jgi:hypothetical protein